MKMLCTIVNRVCLEFKKIMHCGILFNLYCLRCCMLQVSTVAVPGIYNSPFLPYPTEVELELRKAKPQEHSKPKDARPKYNPTATRYDLPPSRPKSLPPIHTRPQVGVHTTCNMC